MKLLTAAAAIVSALVFAAAALAVTPVPGTFITENWHPFGANYKGGAKVQVLPGSKSALVYLSVKYMGKPTNVTLMTNDKGVPIVGGKFSYAGKVTFLLFAKNGVTRAPGTGTVSGTFTSAKKLTLSFSVTKGAFKASWTGALTFLNADQH